MHDKIRLNVGWFAVAIALCILAVGCGEASNRKNAKESRETVIERNIGTRTSVAGEKYENALLPFEEVTDDDVKYLADHHPKIRQIILGPLHAGPFEKWKSVEQLSLKFFRRELIGQC